MKICIYVVCLLGMVVSPVFAGEVDVVKIDVHQESGGTYRFDVTLRHDDTGWKHYADRWEILTPDGTVLATRVLQHPHVHEQPFTRSLSGVAIGPDIKKVVIRGHDLVDGYGGRELTVSFR
ncbi:MAG: hypothetical protein DSY50_04395 [Desulfobulbus sp.]|nr:MAG: hypothetical protein DSY50_04395 [Desulfobulbus sp.]RUM39292.1 MAG: hypothetical protein DSY58_00730 [Desulfobulbus sp.]